LSSFFSSLPLIIMKFGRRLIVRQISLADITSR
jgi:hypothetical protein